MNQIKSLLSDDRFHDAWDALSRVYEDDPGARISLSKHLSKFPKDFLSAQGFIFKRIGILSGYTTQLLTPLLRLDLFLKKIHVEVLESDYGTFEQVIHSGDPAWKEFGPDVCYFCVGTEHLGIGDMDGEVRRWTELWDKARRLLGCEIIQNNFEEPLHKVFGNLELRQPESRTSYVRELNRRLVQSAPKFVHFFDVDSLASYYGRKSWKDEKLYDLSKIPVAYTYLPQYAEYLSRIYVGIFGRSKKCLVLDLDNTLWGGVIGDDGLAGIAIGQESPQGEAYHRFQTFIQALNRRGILLAVCSKNEESIAKQPFLHRPEMVLRLEDFSCFVANWNPKPQNIVKIAEQLSLGLDSFVFIDDNPVEREIVRNTLPEVEVLEISDEPSEYTAFLSESGLFESVFITPEDLQRSRQYQANQTRETLLRQSGSYDDFLKGLEMVGTLQPFEATYLSRITQLINKTNQFNLTMRRYSESDVTRLSQDVDWITRSVGLKDKFGDHGLISAFMGRTTAPGRMLIDIWLMSCRVLKRNVELFLFQDVLRELVKKNFKVLQGEYIPTAKNALVKELFRDFGFQLMDCSGGPSAKSEFWEFDLTDSTQVEAVLNRKPWIRTT